MQIERPPAWLEAAVIDGLRLLIAARLDFAPPADAIDKSCDAWLIALMSTGLEWEDKLDAGRIAQAFARLLRTHKSFPPPAALLECMAPRKPQQSLPSPQYNKMSPELREKVDAIVHRAPRTPDATRDQLLAVLSRHIGAGNGIGVAELAAQLHSNARHVRTLVTDLRMDGEHVCGTPETGYFMAETSEDLVATCEFLKSRALKSLLLASRMTNVSIPDLVGQMKLPT